MDSITDLKPVHTRYLGCKHARSSSTFIFKIQVRTDVPNIRSCNGTTASSQQLLIMTSSLVTTCPGHVCFFRFIPGIDVFQIYVWLERNDELWALLLLMHDELTMIFILANGCIEASSSIHASFKVHRIISANHNRAISCCIHVAPPFHRHPFLTLKPQAYLHTRSN
jgi:hypothetical protein